MHVQVLSLNTCTVTQENSYIIMRPVLGSELVRGTFMVVKYVYDYKTAEFCVDLLM